ncbi:MAG: hypothetical protein ACLVB5_15055 [Christensenellales bacterium]
MQRLGDAGLLLQRDRRDDAAAHARLRALRLGIVAYALARRIAARLRGLGGLLRRSRVRAACVSGCGGRLRLGGTDAVIRPRRTRRLSGLRLIAAGRRRGCLLARRFARHARAARLAASCGLSAVCSAVCAFARGLRGAAFAACVSPSAAGLALLRGAGRRRGVRFPFWPFWALELPLWF